MLLKLSKFSLILQVQYDYNEYNIDKAMTVSKKNSAQHISTTLLSDCKKFGKNIE